MFASVGSLALRAELDDCNLAHHHRSPCVTSKPANLPHFGRITQPAHLLLRNESSIATPVIQKGYYNSHIGQIIICVICPVQITTRKRVQTMRAIQTTSGDMYKSFACYRDAIQNTCTSFPSTDTQFKTCADHLPPYRDANPKRAQITCLHHLPPTETQSKTSTDYFPSTEVQPET